MNFVPLLGLTVAVFSALGVLWRWMDRRMKRQDERSKAMGLALHFLIQKADQKPDEYVVDRLRDSLREDF